MAHSFWTFAPIKEIGETDVRAVCSCKGWSSSEPEAENPGKDVNGYTTAGELVRDKLYERYEKHVKENK